MSRETQYIGLTQAAKDFVGQCDELPSDNSTCGMFDEDIPLRKWNMHPVFLASLADYGRAMVIREVVQEVPWSSGPMIFTCLEFDWDNGGTALAFEWVHDPTLSRAFCQHLEDVRWEQEHPGEECRVMVIRGEEYDQEKGVMWV